MLLATNQFTDKRNIYQQAAIVLETVGNNSTMPIKEQNLQQQRNNSYPKQMMPSWNKRIPEAEEQNAGLGQVTAVLRRKIAVIVSVTVIVTTAAAAWTSTRTPEYEGKFQLLVEPLKSSENELLVLLSRTLQQNVNEITKQNKTDLDYQALVEVLKSPKVVAPVVSKLQSQYPDIKYDQLVGNDVDGKAVSRIGTLNINRIKQGKELSRVIEVRYRESNPDKIQTVLSEISQAYRHYSLEQQQTNLSQGIKFVDQQVPKVRQRVSSLQRDLQALQQRYGVFNPELQGDQLLKRQDENVAQIRETEKKLAESKSLYASLQGQLGMQQNEAIAASALSESPQYQQILTRIRDIEAKIATESARFREDSPIIQSLREQRNQLLPLLNQEARNAVGNSISNARNLPQVGTYQNTVRVELIQQLANTANQIRLLETSLQANYRAQQQLNQQVKEYPVVSRQYSNMQRDLRVATDTLTQMLGKKEALRLDAAQQEIPWELIMPPTIPRDKTGKLIAVSPNHPRDIILGAVAGLLLGILTAFFIENAESVLHDFDEVKRATKLSVLGNIPFEKDLKKELKKLQLADVSYQTRKKGTGEDVKRTVKSRQEEASTFKLAFYSLYNKIQSLGYEIPIRSMAISSAGSSVGKTTVAANIAQIAAETGKRVLLIDANLRNPQLHHNLGIVNAKGLSEVLSDGLDLNDVIAQSPNDENLFVVTAGQVPQNPTKLFSSQRMQRFVEKSQEEFDLVIYDTSKLMGSLDTHILAQRLDAIVLVVGLGKTDRNAFHQALDELKTSRLPVLGIVTNHPKL
ncbi:polysaccharide biosynthesis tyrosine autokinase [Aetokthonos hydrillicola Thurmond2011]|uniref:Polysaccharide biosynthesis tyrosine autokinase n=2 Tax=Aetokthonos TaxID=1550243 RepID=A0AAP5I8B0_9CYAN|nr:polysaccharide biosynthesis tyrosine autokinase [Aetokthonos hydrillicola]MDR9895063.1 polysaccharide biosynthesis tyrosine autokinase [Aetokthonos hydrillicola Thurmond2011]